MFRLTLLTTVLSGILLNCLAFAEEQSKKEIAAKYVHDVGIERDASVIFAENFETGSLAEIAKRWGYANNKDGKVQSFSDDVPPGSAGCRSLQMTGTLGENSGGDLYTVFKPGFDKVYLRFYTKFAPDHGYEHHFVALGGYNPPTPWPNPRAGTRPRGDDRIAVFIDPIGHYGRYPPPGVWGLYTYWHEMKISADGRYWGNVLSPATPVPVARARWVCVELMIKLNSAPEKNDGELALWIDGKPAMHFAAGRRRGPWSGMGFQLVESGGVPLEGLRLRTSMDLKINHLWLEHYVDEGAQRHNKVANPNRINRVWFDDIVVAKSYIGPIQTKEDADGKKETQRQSHARPTQPDPDDGNGRISVNRSTAASYEVVAVENPAYRPNEVFLAQEDLRSPRFKDLRSRYGLDEVVKGGTDEFGRILLLRNWIRRRIVTDRSKPAVDNDDALRILEEGPRGGHYHCGHISKVQNAVMNAMGYVTRCVFVGAGEKEARLSGAHGVNEIWSNTYCKWVLMDAELDSHFEKEGLPLSGLEIRDEVLRDGAANVVRVRGPERKPAARVIDDTWGQTPRTYTWISWYLDGNRHTIWPKQISGVEVVYDDEYWRSHTWYRGGKKHWAYDAGYFRPIRDRRLVEWTPNVLDVKTQINGDAAEVHIASCTPNLKEYQMKNVGGQWRRVEERFVVQLTGNRERRLLRSVNLAGVCGPEYRLVVERR